MTNNIKLNLTLGLLASLGVIITLAAGKLGVIELVMGQYILLFICLIITITLIFRNVSIMIKYNKNGFKNNDKQD